MWVYRKTPLRHSEKFSLFSVSTVCLTAITINEKHNLKLTIHHRKKTTELCNRFPFRLSSMSQLQPATDVLTARCMELQRKEISLFLGKTITALKVHYATFLRAVNKQKN